MSRYGWMLLLMIVSVLLVSGCQPIVAEEEAPKCDMPGAWVRSYSGGAWDTPLIMLNTLTPLDPAGKKLAYVMRWVNSDVTFRNPDYEDVDYTSEFVGEAVKTGADTYDFSLLGYGVNERPGDRNEIKYIVVINGTLICEDDDNVTSDVLISVYAGEQDADQDGLPDEDEVPQCYGPMDLAGAQRIPQMPRCEPESQ